MPELLHTLANAQQLQVLPCLTTICLILDAKYGKASFRDNRCWYEANRNVYRAEVVEAYDRAFACDPISALVEHSYCGRFRWSLLSTLQTSISSLLRFLLHQLTEEALKACQREQIFVLHGAESMVPRSLRWELLTEVFSTRFLTTQTKRVDSLEVVKRQPTPEELSDFHICLKVCKDR